MKDSVMFSICFEYVEAIFDGTKQYEFRKKNIKPVIEKQIDTVFIFVPDTKRIVGYFVIGSIVEGRQPTRRCQNSCLNDRIHEPLD